VAIGTQQLIDLAVVFGNRTPGLNRTAQAAAAYQVMHGVALALGADLLLNRPDQDPQVNHGRQGPQQAGAGAPQVPCGPGKGQLLPQPGQTRELMFAD